MNYKKIPHTTEFLRFPEITPVLSAAGAPPTRSTEPRWSVPALADGPAILSDSTPLADHLEATRPAAPSVYPHGRAAQLRWTAALEADVVRRMAPLVLPETPRILPPEDVAYFYETRKHFFGVCPPCVVRVRWD